MVRTLRTGFAELLGAASSFSSDQVKLIAVNQGSQKSHFEISGVQRTREFGGRP